MPMHHGTHEHRPGATFVVVAPQTEWDADRFGIGGGCELWGGKVNTAWKQSGLCGVQNATKKALNMISEWGIGGRHLEFKIDIDSMMGRGWCE
jgi:hypothetical protein